MKRSPLFRPRAWPYLVAALAVVVSTFPIFWILTIALKTRLDAFAMPPVWFFTPVWENFIRAWTSSGFSSAFFNSVYVCVLGNLLSLAAGIPAAYYLNKRHVPGRRTVLVWLLVSYMLPEFLFIMPVYVLCPSSNDLRLFGLWKNGVSGSVCGLI